MVHEGWRLQKMTGQPQVSYLSRLSAMQVGSKGGSTAIGASVVGPVICCVCCADAGALVKRLLDPRKGVSSVCCCTCQPSSVVGCGW